MDLRICDQSVLFGNCCCFTTFPPQLELLLRIMVVVSLSDQVDSALNDLFNLDSLTAQIKSVISGHEHTQELLVTLQER